MTEIHDRVTNLELEVADVRHLATKADHDTSLITAALGGHTGVLNAIGETQGEHGRKLAKHTRMLEQHTRMHAQHDKRFDELERKVDEGFAQANKNFVEVGRQLGQLRTGQERITELLTEHFDKPKET